jgi:hypothetical protein
VERGIGVAHATKGRRRVEAGLGLAGLGWGRAGEGLGVGCKRGWERRLKAVCSVSTRFTCSILQPCCPPGTWYLGLYNKGAAAVSHTVSLSFFACPGNCNARGTCDAATGTCACEQVGRAHFLSFFQVGRAHSGGPARLVA